MARTRYNALEIIYYVVVKETYKYTTRMDLFKELKFYKILKEMNE